MPLDSLAPDQRAVLELVLREERSYADLAGMLGISDEAVRRRAREGVAALADDGDGLGTHERERVADYLLGQLDGDEHAATAAMLASSPPARAWAEDVAEELRPVARRELPELPAERRPPEPDRRSSRLGGAILLAVCTVVLLGALGAWLLTRDPEQKTTATATATPTPAATPQALAQLPLRAVGDSKAKGAMELNATREGQVGLFVLARGVRPSGPDEAYAVWLTDARRKAFRIGFEAKGEGGSGQPNGELAMSGPSPDIDQKRFTRALTQYDRLVISLETSDAATKPASVVLRGSLKELQRVDG